VALPQKSGRDLTPKVLANFSPGFPALGKSAEPLRWVLVISPGEEE